MAGLELPRAHGDLGAALKQIRDALSEQLLPGVPLREWALEVEEDGSGYGTPAWSDASGCVYLPEDTTEALAAKDRDAIAAVAHQVAHAIGSGPAFFDLEDQLLEEAIAEIIAQSYLEAFGRAFGVELGEPPLLFQVVDGDLEVAHPTAANVSVERFARVAAWLEGCDGTSDPEDFEDAALAWAIKLKSTPADKRFSELAAAAADLGGDDEDGAAAEFLEGYLRGYMKQLRRSRTGFDGLRYALDRAWLDESDPPAERPLESQGWRAELEQAERVTLLPKPPKGAIANILLAPASPEVAAVVRRSLDARHLLWSARSAASAR